MTDYAARIRELGIVLPEPLEPVGAYAPVVIAANTAYLSGQISKVKGESFEGKVGKDLTLEQGRQAARCAARNVLAVIQTLVGFAKFERMLRVVGYVQCAPDFYEISKVVNGASDLFKEVFGDAGIHARSAVGMASLPLNVAVELEVTLQLRG